MKKIAVFKSTHSAIKADKLLDKNNFNYKIIPVPKEISSQCGIAIEINKNDILSLKNILNINNIKAIYYDL